MLSASSFTSRSSDVLLIVCQQLSQLSRDTIKNYNPKQMTQHKEMLFKPAEEGIDIGYMLFPNAVKRFDWGKSRLTEVLNRTIENPLRTSATVGIVATLAVACGRREEGTPTEAATQPPKTEKPAETAAPTEPATEVPLTATPEEGTEVFQPTSTQETEEPVTPTEPPTSEPTETTEPTEEPVTSTPEETPTPEATPSPEVSQDMEEIIERAEDFLNGEIPKEEDLWKIQRPLERKRARLKTGEQICGGYHDADDKTVELGYCEIFELENPNYISGDKQVVLLGASSFENYQFMVIGTKDIETDERVVLPVIFGIEGSKNFSTVYLSTSRERDFDVDDKYVQYLQVSPEAFLEAVNKGELVVDENNTIIFDVLGETFTLQYHVDPNKKQYEDGGAPPDLVEDAEQYYFPYAEANWDLVANPSKLRRRIGNILEGPDLIQWEKVPRDFTVGQFPVE
jgi:hypothetical protein